jgi:hypothetical protein
MNEQRTAFIYLTNNKKNLRNKNIILYLIQIIKSKDPDGLFFILEYPFEVWVLT